MDVVYTLIAEVDGVVVYRQEYTDISTIEEELYKPERAVEDYINGDPYMMEEE